MEFHWDEVNEQEIADHGIDRATAEAVFFAFNARKRSV